MGADRRQFLKQAAAAYAALGVGAASAQGRRGGMPLTESQKTVGYKRIATEEAWGPPELFDEWRKVLAAQPADEPGFEALWRGMSGSAKSPFEKRLTDIGEGRIADMDAVGVDMQVLSLTSPGVQVFDADKATALAASSNDRLAEAVRKYPDRFAGLIAIAPQDPVRAAKEIERGMTKLGLHGIIVNSHTKDHYLDEKQFTPIWEAAEAYNAPIYIHPRAPSSGMLKPFIENNRDLLRGDLGFSVEVELHTLAIINAGIFDRFPKATVVIGHGGENIPYNLFRLDATYRVRRPPTKSKNPPSYYMKNNVYITNSGVAWAPAVQFAQHVLGVDRVLYAMDYPYEYVAEEVKILDAMPINYEDKKAFYQTNAERVFNLNKNRAAAG